MESIRKSKKTSDVKSPKGKKTQLTDTAGDAGFDKVLAGVQGEDAERRLGKILSDIQKLSGMLAHRRLLEDLEDYRNRVGDFLKLYMEEVLTVREAGGGRRGLRKKQMIVVKRVNVELEELSRMVLGGAPDFKIVKELGTIEGLLLDLYR